MLGRKYQKSQVFWLFINALLLKKEIMIMAIFGSTNTLYVMLLNYQITRQLIFFNSAECPSSFVCEIMSDTHMFQGLIRMQRFCIQKNIYIYKYKLITNINIISISSPILSSCPAVRCSLQYFQFHRGRGCLGTNPCWLSLGGAPLNTSEHTKPFFW